MELQLGLALPASNPSNGFDLNCCAYESNSKGLLKNSSTTMRGSKKRSLGQAFEQNREVPPTLPLLLLIHNQPNDDDDPQDLYKNSCASIKNDHEGGDGIVGWPPINSWRKKHCQGSHGDEHDDQLATNNRVVEIIRSSSVGVRGLNLNFNMFVKVKMDGIGITRKVDLSLHQSFQTLRATLMNMFGKYHENSMGYALSYQDKRGDWRLAEDVPWRQKFH
ncbi:Auxin-responsive protein [Quillaja saponaria]|uniref:Auxin-induced protein n=1 Tax=Quillaja saponaria TaxID=32244 RepID=A0AAD7PIE0_QUISA|nr:Auxin-responsive protein [Quillaja saponaria]